MKHSVCAGGSGPLTSHLLQYHTSLHSPTWHLLYHSLILGSFRLTQPQSHYFFLLPTAPLYR